MRALLLLALVAGCTEKKACKPETVLLVIDGAAGAYSVTVTISDDLDRHAASTLALRGADGGSVEVDFSGYPEGHTFNWDVIALDNSGHQLGHAADSLRLSPGCTLINVHLQAGTVDLAGADFSRADLRDSGVTDLRTPGCTSPAQCVATGICADGYCCDSDCIGPCESCAVPGQEGHCVLVSPAPVAPKSCGGSGVCTGVCDGTNPDCVYPTTECAPAVCRNGFVTSARSCNQGSCPGGTPSPPCTNNICGTGACATVTEIATGQLHTCAVLSDGTMTCWGRSDLQLFGISVPQPSSAPVHARTNVKHVAAGDFWTCAVLGDGTVECSGLSNGGVLGDGTMDFTGKAGIRVLTGPGTPLTDVVDITAGLSSTCAVTSTHHAFCWGNTGDITSGLAGGSGTASYYALPVCGRDTGDCSTVASDIAEMALGWSAACYRTINGQVACWGKNDFGECGQAPGVVGFPKTVPGITANHIAAASDVSCAVLADATAVCWGRNDGGLLGRGLTDGNPHPTPAPVCATTNCSATLQQVTDLSMRQSHACAVAQTVVTCWGRNNHGQLLTGDKNDRFYAPIPSSSPVPATQVSVGAFHSCLNDPSTGPRCWGANDWFQTGSTDPADKLTLTAPNLGN